MLYIGPLLTGVNAARHCSRPVAAAKGGWGRRSRRPGNFSTSAKGGGPSSSSMPGIDAVRPRRRRVMSTERHRKVANRVVRRRSCPQEVDGAVGLPPVGRRANSGGAVIPRSRRRRQAHRRRSAGASGAAARSSSEAAPSAPSVGPDRHQVLIALRARPT